MSKVEYVGPRVEISNHGIVTTEMQKRINIFIYTALEILKDIDNDYDKKPFYIHQCENKPLKNEEVNTILKYYEKILKSVFQKSVKSINRKFYMR